VSCIQQIIHCNCLLRIAGHTQFNTHTAVWIVGSSIIKNAFVASKERSCGVNLGLRRLDVFIWWQGKSGARLWDVKGQLKTMLKYEEAPRIIIIHIGGYLDAKTLCERIKEILIWVHGLLPHTMLVWYQILPRLSWRYSTNLNAMDRSRNRIHTSTASFLNMSFGSYIRYPEIKMDQKFFVEDGVHLSNLGCQIFLNTLQGGIEMIRMKWGDNVAFPEIHRK